jgi:uracil-DNA glycosylase
MTEIILPKNINPQKVRIIMVCEALPENIDDYFYSSTNSLYVTNTIKAFVIAGIKVNTIEDIIKEGVYLTVAVKAPRKGLSISLEIINRHSFILEEEINLFPNVRAILLMGDIAIKAFNLVSQRSIKTKTISTGSTYKIRRNKFYFKNCRVFPSYLQTGKNFLIEKSKRAMVAEDIREAFKLL